MFAVRVLWVLRLFAVCHLTPCAISSSKKEIFASGRRPFLFCPLFNLLTAITLPSVLIALLALGVNGIM